MEIPVSVCPYCGQNNLGRALQTGGGRLFVDEFAYGAHATGDSSPVEVILCRHCGSILYQRALRPSIFPALSDARSRALLEKLEENGFLLINENPHLPSVGGLGFDMADLIPLMERAEVFYCKAFGGQAICLTVRNYQLLRRCKPTPAWPDGAKQVYNAIAARESADKTEVRQALGMDAKAFDKLFNFLLQHLLITACAGKRCARNWYSYRYCTADAFDRRVEGLHFSGDARAELRRRLPQMDDRAFARLCR